MSGFKLCCLDQDADRISVQSTHSPTWAPERRKYRWMPARVYDVGVAPNEVMFIKSREANRVVLTSVDNKLVIRSNRRGTILLIAGREQTVHLTKDETLIIQHADIAHPTRGHRPPTDSEIEAGFTP